MALTPIAQPAPKVKRGRSGGGGIGRNIGAGLGAVIGAAPGIIAGNPGLAAKGGLGGAATGASLGGMVGEAVQPAQEAQVTQQQAGVPLTALQESGRGQQILAGLHVARDDPELSEYTAPLTRAYIQNRVNLHKMG